MTAPTVTRVEMNLYMAVFDVMPLFLKMRFDVERRGEGTPPYTIHLRIILNTNHIITLYCRAR